MGSINCENGLGNQWLLLLKQASKQNLSLKAGVKRIYYKLTDGREMLEDWKVLDGKARELTGRYWKKKTIVGKEVAWEVEIGEQVQLRIQSNPANGTEDLTTSSLIKENSSTPIVSSRSTAGCYEWRIRNLPGPESNYKVKVDPDNYSLIVSTANKKYYKILSIPDSQRLRLELCEENLMTKFANRTLIIQYKKPVCLIELENMIWKEVIALVRASEENQSPVGCPQT